jgi:hypothetical protein
MEIIREIRKETHKMMIKEIRFYEPGKPWNQAFKRVDNLTPEEIAYDIKEQAKHNGRTEYEYVDTETVKH